MELATALAEPKKGNPFDTLDLSALELPEDEPLSGEIIKGYQKLARHVIGQVIKDLDSPDEDVRNTATRFCLDDNRAHHELRMLWLGWIDMSEEVLAEAALMRLKWSTAATSASTARQSRVLPTAAGRPLPRSGPTQPEGLSYRA